MGDTYTRQSSGSIVDGSTIEASHFNDEFDQLLAAFAASTGHTHDGTAAEGGPVTKLLGNTLTFGAGTAGTDITITFDGETSDGVMYWMEDEDHFKFADDIVVDSTKRLYFNDEGGEYIYGDGTDLYLTSGADINIPANIGLTFGDDGEKIEGDGTDLTISANNLNVDAAADINLDADGGDIFFKDGGTTFGSATNTSGNLIIKSGTTTALTFSGANATLAGDLTISGDDLTMGTNTSGAVLVADGTNFNPVVISGDISIGTTGTAAIGSDVIVNADINSSAAIADSKLATISTADKVAGGAIQIDSGTDGTSITLADTDKFLVDDGGTTKYINASQLNTYSSGCVAADNIGTGDSAVTIATSSGAITIDAQAGDADIIFKGTDSSSDITALTLDMSEAGAATFNDKVVATELDISGNMDIDGTSNLDAVDIDGAVQIDGTVTVGVDDTGLDVKFFGATSGSYILWDESADSLLLTDSTPIKIGDSQDLTLYHDGTNSYITNAVGALKVATETSGIAITIGHTTSETTIADNATVTGNLSVGGNFDVTGTIDFSDSAITNAGDMQLDSITGDGDTDTAITFSGSNVITIKANNENQITFNDGSILPVTDNNIDLGSGSYEFKDAYFDGTVTTDGLTVSSTTNLDGAIQVDNTITVGVDDTGYDVKFFGDTASAYMLWDTSADDLILGGAAGLIVPDGKLTLGSTAVTSTAAELNIIDGGTSATSTTLADADRLVTNDNGTMVQVALSDLKTYLTSAGYSSEDPTALAIALG